MTRRRWLTSLLAIVLFLSAGTTAFVGGVVAQEGDRPVLRFGVNAADLATLDPHFASGTQDRTVVDMIFNGLVRFVPGNSAEIEPDIAVAIPEPEIVDGKQVWTFELRDDVMCHPRSGQRGLPPHRR
jgi:ABC-type transport system substrate-binding protein